MKSKTVSDLNKQLREYRNSLGLVECRLWVSPAVKEKLLRMYPPPKYKG